MLSSPRWGLMDTFAAVVTVILMARVFGPPPTPELTPEQRTARIVAAFTTPIAEPSTLISRGANEQLFARFRCMALAEARHRAVCETRDWEACHAAGQRADAIKVLLWPKGRAGQFALSAGRKVSLYADAYQRLSRPRSIAEQRSSRLILPRDSAMCKRYREHFEARLNGQQTRQPG